MSLLLEALKKAEKAKDEAQRRASGGAAGAAAGAPAQASVFDPEMTVLEEGRQVRTRDQLPDISAPLEILSDDLRPAASAKAAPLELALTDEPPMPRETKPSARRAGPRAEANAQNAAASAERATAQRVFEAKFREPNPRLPFFIAMGVLGLFAVGTVGYFWVQLRPPSALVNANPPRSPDEKPVDAATRPPAAATASAQSAPVAGAIPGLPSTAPAPLPAAAAPAAAAPATTVPVAAATVPAAPASAARTTVAPAKPAAARAAQRSAEAPAARPEDRAVSVNRGGPQIHAQVASGYAAYQAGDLQKARADYQQVLREESSNRDALLGLAAVEMRAQRYDQSDAHYQRVLQIDPRDPHAQAGLLALRSQQLDPVQVESRVKSMLAGNRDAQVLHFTLGNQYAQQGRWAEAQQAYFKAFAADPDSPDFAFNLAVSMDQLRQPKLALEYYRRALALSEKRSASFAPETARTRVQQLSR